MRADGLGGAGGGERRVRDVEGGLGGVVQQPGLAAAGEDLALDADDGGDVRMPVGAGEFVGGVEDGDGAALVAVASLLWLWAAPIGAVVAAISRSAGAGSAGCP